MKKDEARTFIKTHIRNRGHHPVDITEHMVRKWWHIINVAVFNGHLNKPHHVTIKNLKKVWAWAHPCCNKGQISITIYPTFKTRKMFLSVLVHEMVHAWELQHHSIMGHGKRFFEWKARIKWTTSLPLDKEIE